MNYCAYVSDTYASEDQVGGRQKTKNSKPRKDEYTRVDPTRDKSKDRKRDFNNRREVKRGSYE